LNSYIFFREEDEIHSRSFKVEFPDKWKMTGLMDFSIPGRLKAEKDRILHSFGASPAYFCFMSSIRQPVARNQGGRSPP